MRCVERSWSGIVDHIRTRLFPQGHLVGEVDMGSMMNVSRCRARVALPIAPRAEHDGAAGVSYLSPAMAAGETDDPCEH